MAKPNPNRPQLWFQQGWGDGTWNSIGSCSRLRIFYPDGRAEWMPIGNERYTERYNNQWTNPCWNVKPLIKSPVFSLMEQRMNQADAFDKQEGFDKKMEFVCNL